MGRFSFFGAVWNLISFLVMVVLLSIFIVLMSEIIASCLVGFCQRSHPSCIMHSTR